MQPPEGISDVALWIKHCRQIRARADDVLSGRMGLIVAARELSRLRVWTRGETDPDLATFRELDAASGSLPVGPVREQWAPHALAKCDEKILALESRWRERALAAAQNLVERYAWSIDARNEIRRGSNSGGTVV